MSKKASKKGEFFEKHQPLGDEKGGSFVDKGDVKRRKTVTEAMHEMEQARQKWHLSLAKAEENLTQYLQTSDPVIAEVYDADEGKMIEKPVIWVRRPSMKEIKDLTPTSQEMKIMESLRGKKPSDMMEIPESATEYDKRFYNKLSELVVAPEKTADQWRDVMNPWLLRLFWGYIAKVGDVLGAEVEGF